MKQHTCPVCHSKVDEIDGELTLCRNTACAKCDPELLKSIPKAKPKSILDVIHCPSDALEISRQVYEEISSKNPLLMADEEFDLWFYRAREAYSVYCQFRSLRIDKRKIGAKEEWELSLKEQIRIKKEKKLDSETRKANKATRINPETGERLTSFDKSKQVAIQNLMRVLGLSEDAAIAMFTQGLSTLKGSK